MQDTAAQRQQSLMNWLKSIAESFQLDLETLHSASSDASFRRYYRLQAGVHTRIVMDAPPSHENNEAFVDVQARLAQVGAKVPEILAYDAEHGFMLLSDLGTENFYHALQTTTDPAIVQAMYRLAIQELVRMQQADTTDLPVYDAARMLDELQLFEEWYIKQYCKTELTETEKKNLSQLFETLVADNVRHGQVLVHRDFHSPNIMMPTDSALQPGLIDFQDAVVGPITYDLASMVMDARYTWDEDQQIDWAIRYWQAAHLAGLDIDTDFAEFHRAYEWMSVQRNLRILGVFSRLSIRDGKHHYLDHMPRVNQYLRQVVVRYEEFNPLRRLFDRLENKQTVLGMTI
ncbi:aminoglycoside phosphotransferase family protein [Paenalcaligenes faecalis]|uniref:aminoglycoside phosphotransferase family protein n=1 Tax=Paenalcaligenes faecalis TaxID=2980099 RepID=UPI0022B97CB1|nr:phosphotransferase [Paenalcaligenes faecalis]